MYILPAFNRTAPPQRIRGQPTRLLVVLGSGGHTAEILSLLDDLNPDLYTHRSYVVSGGDDFSALKAIEFEEALEAKRQARAYEPNDNRLSRDTLSIQSTYDISSVPRARAIHQTLMTTPISALRCLSACFQVLRSPRAQLRPAAKVKLRSLEKTKEQTPSYTYPDLILVNGPATALLVVLASLMLKFLGARGTRGKMRTIYVESWARVKKLSLTGRILLTGGMVNRILVQWEALARQGQGEYKGALVR